MKTTEKIEMRLNYKKRRRKKQSVKGIRKLAKAFNIKPTKYHF